MVVRLVIQDALAEIGAYAQGEAVSAPDAQMALRYLQRMIDAWGAQRLTMAVQARVAFTIPGGTASMTIGEAGADITAQRPTWVSMLRYVNPGSSPEVEVTMGQMDDDQYAAQSIKELDNTLSTQFFYETSLTTALGTLTFWPVPTGDLDCYLYYPQAVGVPAALTDDLTGPPGYLEAFVYQLALRLCRPFGRPLTPDLQQLAANAFATMKRPNTEPGLLGVDAALVPTAGGGYNILNDGYTGHN